MQGDLQSEVMVRVRFSETDPVGVVWHGNYVKYLEDAREEFGRQYQLEYLRIADFGYYAPLVDMQFHYRKPITYGMRPRIDIIYRPTLSAKIVFDYEIHDPETEELMASGTSVQVFMDKNYQLVWSSPEFYEKWKQMWGVGEEI